jgi:hypothetical protein
MVKNQDRDPDPGRTSRITLNESLETILGLKILKFLMRIRIRDGKNTDP